MRRISILIVLLIVSITTFAQSNDQKKESIIKAGLSENAPSKKIEEYFNACFSLGTKYYNTKRYNKAINLYEKVANLNLDGHGQLGLSDLTPKALLIYKAILSKLGHIYNQGIGVKSSRLKAFRYYGIQPTPFDINERIKLSKELLGNSTPAILDTLNSNDSIKVYRINPFLCSDTQTLHYFDELLKEINLKLNKNASQKCSIAISVINFSEIGIAQSNLFLSRLSSKFDQTISDKVITDLDLSTHLEDIPYLILIFKLEN